MLIAIRTIEKDNKMTGKKIANALLVMFISGVFAQTAMAQSDPIITQSTSSSSTYSESTTTVKSPPPSAIAPAITSINSDLCVVGASGAVQTQIFGFSMGSTTVDLNCERLKLSKTLYDMGMKVAAVATMCQDRRVWDAMISAGTPCPIDGKIGVEAKQIWDANPHRIPGNPPKVEKVSETPPVKQDDEKTSSSSIGTWFANLFRSE